MTGLRRLVPANHPAFFLLTPVLIALASFGCTRSAQREATPAPNSAAAAESEPPSSQPGSAAMPPSEEMEDRVRSTSSPVGAPQPAAPPEEQSRVGSRKAAPQGARHRSTSAKPAVSRAEGSGGLEPSGAAEPLGPTLADPPELRAALADFQGAFEQLSAGGTCDDACRAFSSMQRAAKRICELVVTRDPKGRCRAAEERVEQARRDLISRCGSCD